MTTANTFAKSLRPGGRVRLPDPAQRELDEMTAYDHVYKYASHRYLALHFGNPDTTLVEYDRWIVATPEDNRSRARRPDLLIAFNVSAADYAASNGYIISEQGKPPDFVLEVASESTAEVDVVAKRRDYAELAIPEYWRFDETGEHHGTPLAGDLLTGNAYVPVPIEELPDGNLQGYSAALDLHIRWEQGQLAWYDPATGRPILTYEDQRDRADAEHQARARAEARVHELEAELRRLQNP